MAWYLGDNGDSTDNEDEAGVGLIESKSESATRNWRELRQSWLTKTCLGMALMLSNIAWFVLCLMLWREAYTPRCPAQMSDGGFEADFGTVILNT